MTNREIEQRVRTAVTHAAPDQLDSILSSCDLEKKEGAVLDMTERKTSKQRNSGLAAIAAAAAVFILCVGGFRLMQRGNGNKDMDDGNVTGQNVIQQTAGQETISSAPTNSVILLDVNPSLALTVDAGETVLAAEALNEDAKDILGTMDLTGTSLEVAVNAIIGSMLQKGYLGDMQNSILVSVEDQDAARSAELQKKVSSAIASAMQSDSVEAAVLSQAIDGDDTVLAELANQYHISLGKAALIQEVIRQIPTLSFEELAPRSINEIALISASKHVAGSSVQQTGSASDKAYIGTEEALNLVYAYAGVDPSEVLWCKAEFDWEDGVMAYEIEFETGTREYEYDIDASTGELIKTEMKDKTHAKPEAPADNSGYIGETAAIAAALNHAGVAEQDAVYIHCYDEYDDGRPQNYCVEFMAGNTRYEYEIDFYTGAVLECSQENYGHHDHDNQHHSSPEASSPQSGSASYIGEASALEIALNHAGIEESNLTKQKIKLDEDDGRMIYEVELEMGRIEYEYDIDAVSGEILKAEMDTDD